MDAALIQVSLQADAGRPLPKSLKLLNWVKQAAASQQCATLAVINHYCRVPNARKPPETEEEQLVRIRRINREIDLYIIEQAQRAAIPERTPSRAATTFERASEGL